MMIPPDQPPVISTGTSLRVRMLLSASAVLILFLGIMGLVLDNANRQTTEQRVAERLQLHVWAFLAATEEGFEDGQFTITLPTRLQEPLFNQMGTGLYGLVFLEFSSEIWRSESASDLELSEQETTTLLTDSEPGAARFGQLAATAQHNPLFYLVYPVIWQFGDNTLAVQFVVLEDVQPFLNEVRAFRTSLWGWLVGGVLVLVGLQGVIMVWGLSPIARVETDLKEIEEGRKSYLEDRYPSEISGVIGHFNQLLAAERRQREQYRTTLADLAHSLKTPLSILKTEAQNPDTPASPALAEQVDRMNEIVSYQLERAVSSGSAITRSETAVEPVLNRLIDTLERVYMERAIAIDTQIEAATFPGDERDLMELVGNLLDNACKYGNGRVRLSVTRGSALNIVVEDDGAGIEPAQRDRVLQRGTRLDSREAGQGIGLAVVSEIVDRYGGQIHIDTSELGGARVTVSFRS